MVLVTIPTTLLVSGVFGIYASIMEVTSLTALLLVLTLSFFLHWYFNYEGSNRTLILAAAAFGLGVSHYQPMIILAPVLLGFATYRLRNLKTTNPFMVMGSTTVSFLIALVLPYISIFIINSTKPSTTWAFEPTLQGIFNLATRKDYSGYFLDDAIERSAYFGSGFIQKFVRSQIPYWQMVTEQLSLPFVALAVMGLGLLISRKRDVGIFFVLIWFIVGPLFIGFLGTPVPSDQNLSYHMALGIFQRQLVLSMVVITILATIGAFGIGEAVNKNLKHPFARTLVPLLVIALFVLHFTKFDLVSDQQRKTLIPKYAHLMLASAKPNSVIICGSDMACFGLLYASEVEKIRPDVTILTTNHLARKYFLHKHPEFYPFSYDQNPFFTANLITWNASKRTTYLTNPSSFYIEYVGLHGDPFYLIPSELLFEVTTTLPDSLNMPTSDFINQVMSTPVSRYDWFMRGFRDYMANIAYFSGVLASHLDSKQVAQSYFDEALTVKPDYADVTDWLSKLYSPGLIASYTTATASDRDYLAKFQRLAGEEKLDDAYKQLLKASYLDPENQSVRLELAKLYQRGNFTDLAKTELEHLELFAPIEASIAAQASKLKESM